MLRGNESGSVYPVKLTLSAEMGIKEMQLLLESNLSRRLAGPGHKGRRLSKSHIYGPHTGSRAVIFVDDVHQAKQV